MTREENKAPVKNRHRILMLALGALVMLTVTAVVVTSVFIFNRSTRDQREQIIVNTARLAAEQIDGDRINDWLANGIDADYEATADVLASILHNTPYLQFLYVYQILPDSCHVVFDFDTPDVEANAFRDVIPFDESFSDQIPVLLEGGRIDTIESKDTFGWLLTRYEPVLDFAGNCVAYVGADLSMQGIYDYVQDYVIRIAIIAICFLAGCILIGMRLFVGARRADAMDGLIEQQKRDKKLTREIIEAFAKVIDMKDSYTQGHSSRVAGYTEMLAREMGCDEETIEKYYNIALMHDIGKVAIPDSVLNKPGKLSEEEFRIIQSHTERGYEVLKNISLMPEIAIGANAHHERPDGKGYPQGLKGNDLPQVVQIISMADCFDAMYSNRPYRDRMNFDRVVSIIREVSGTQLSPEVVEAFLRLAEKGVLRDPAGLGGGSMESIENIRSE